MNNIKKIFIVLLLFCVGILLYSLFEKPIKKSNVEIIVGYYLPNTKNIIEKKFSGHSIEYSINDGSYHIIETDTTHGMVSLYDERYVVYTYITGIKNKKKR